MTRKAYCGNLLWQSSLTLLAPIGETDALTLRVRNPVMPRAELVVPRAATVKLACEPTGRAGEWKVALPSFAAWQIGVVFFEPAGS